MSHEASGLKEDRKKVLQRAFSVSSGTLTSRILGLLRDMALGALFDRSVTDAWTAAFRLPNFFRRLLGEGSLSVSLIPVFLEAQAEDPSGARARNFANALYSMTLVLLGVLALIGIVFIEPLFRLLLSEPYALHPEKWTMTLRLGRIMFGFVFFVSTYAFYMGLLNILGSFGLPALAPALLNVSMLIFTFMPAGWFARPGDGLAWGVLLGGFLQAAVLWGSLRARGYLPRWSFQWRSSEMKRFWRRLGPGLVGMGVLQFFTLVNLHFASSLQEGAISYIYWADRLLELPLSLISVSLGTALLPTLSQAYSAGQKQFFQEIARESFLMNSFLAWPAAVGLYLLAGPIVEALFFHGKFSHADLRATTSVLQIHAVSLILISWSRVLMPLYYAAGNAWYPMGASLSSLLVHVVLAPSLMDRWGLEGLLYSGIFAAGINTLILLVGLSRHSVSLGAGALLKPLLKIFTAGAVMGLVAQIYFLLAPQNEEGLQVAILLIMILVSAGVYFLLTSLLGCEQLSRIRRLSRP